MDFFAELKRRKVYRAGVAYLAVAFAALEGASMVFPTFGLGPEVYNVLVLASVLGFPLTLVVAWAFDWTGGGFRRAGSVPRSAAVAPDQWDRPKAALVGAGFVAIVWLGVGLWQPMDPDPVTSVPVDAPVLAVLPFEDFSPDGDQAYFADGLHEEMLHQLAMLRGIRLTSRTSVAHFRGSPATVRAIADSLGARYVMEGSVRRSGDSVQVTVQLIDAPTDNHLWSESYPVALSLDELFGLQRTLASRVARSLGGTLAAGTGRTPGVSPTSDLEAYHAYLRGLYHWSRFDVEDILAARDDLERAVELDPGFGRAHGKLSSVYAVLNNFGGGTQGQLFPQIREHAESAIRHAPDDPVSHMAMVGVYWAVERNWEAARLSLERALELDPGFADARWALAEWHGVIAGNTDVALGTLEEAIRLDPFSVQPLAVKAWVLTNGQRYAEAAATYRELLDMDPGRLHYIQRMAFNMALAGRTDEARARLDELLSDIPEPRPVTLATHLAQAGDTATAREILDQAVALKESGGSVAASDIAGAHSTLGAVDEGLKWLERSFDQEGGVYTLRSPEYRALWGHPRFQVLWERAGLLGEPPQTGRPGAPEPPPS